jgi:O-antigen/teichoic acid export membrane protein
MLVVQAAETPDLWFRAEVKSWPAAIARTTAVVCGAAGKIALAFSDAGVLAFAWLTLGELVLFEAGLWLVYRRDQHPQHGRWRWDRAAALALAREAGVFALAATLGGIAFRIDQLCVPPLLGDAAAGQYFAALRLIEVPTFVAASLATALFPLLAHDEHALRDGRFESVVALLASVAWVTAVATTLLGPWLIGVFFGAAYQPAAHALVVRAWAMLPFFSSMVRAQILAALRAPGIQLVSVLFGLALQTPLGLLLIPRFGLTGAALAFFTTEMLNAWLLPLFLPNLRATLAPQFRGWWLPWWPRAWPRLIGLLSRETPTATPTATTHVASP